MIGGCLKQCSTYINRALAASEIYDAYQSGESVARTAFREGAAIYVTGLMVAAAEGIGLGEICFTGLGAAAVGFDLVLGGGAAATVLVCYPIIGWVILVFAGAAVLGYAAYQTKKAADQLSDGVESVKIQQKLYDFGGWLLDQFNLMGQQLCKCD